MSACAITHTHTTVLFVQHRQRKNILHICAYNWQIHTRISFFAAFFVPIESYLHFRGSRYFTSSIEKKKKKRERKIIYICFLFVGGKDARTRTPLSTRLKKEHFFFLKDTSPSFKVICFVFWGFLFHSQKKPDVMGR